jgi:hypothetical protein
MCDVIGFVPMESQQSSLIFLQRRQVPRQFAEEEALQIAA